jgi:hypothetical protein
METGPTVNSKRTISCTILRSGFDFYNLRTRRYVEALYCTEGSNPFRSARQSGRQRIRTVTFLKVREIRPFSQFLLDKSDCRERAALTADGIDGTFFSEAEMNSPTCKRSSASLTSAVSFPSRV